MGQQTKNISACSVLDRGSAWVQAQQKGEVMYLPFNKEDYLGLDSSSFAEYVSRALASTQLLCGEDKNK